MKAKKKQNQIVWVHTRYDVRTSTKIESNYLEAIILGCSYGQDTHINIGWLIVSKKTERKKEREKERKKERKEERKKEREKGRKKERKKQRKKETKKERNH